MKLTTILTLPAATPAEKARRILDNLAASTARALPARVRYHALITCGVRAIKHDEVVPEVTFCDVLQRTPTGGKV